MGCMSFVIWRGITLQYETGGSSQGNKPLQMVQRWEKMQLKHLLKYCCSSEALELLAVAFTELLLTGVLRKSAVTAFSRLWEGSNVTQFNFETCGYMDFQVLLCLLKKQISVTILQSEVFKIVMLPERGFWWGGCQSVLPGNKGQDKKKLPHISPGEV